MFYYYGGKASAAPKYPAPQFDTVIEPFAGAAGYSCYWATQNPDLRFVLIEKDARVADTWRMLLSDAKLAPLPDVGEKTTDFLMMTTAASNATARSKRMTVTTRMGTMLRTQQRRLTRLRRAMRGRTTIISGDYTEAPPVEATWFVDPPYQLQATATKTVYPRGMGYAAGCDAMSMDYTALGQWCRERVGQTIVCEMPGATWLPFEPFYSATDTLGQQITELAWLSGPQGRLF